MAGGVKLFNRRITENPHDVGESRSGRTRVAFTPLLVIHFSIDELDRVVKVIDVARYGR